MPSVDTMPVSGGTNSGVTSDPTQDLNNKWQAEQSRITKDWYNNDANNRVRNGKAQSYDQYMASLQNPNDFVNSWKLQRAKEGFMRGEFQNTQGNLVDQETKLAQQARAGMPGMENALYNNINGQSQRDLASQIHNIRQNASSRGLLYSGLRSGSENTAASETASNAAMARSQVAPQLEKQASALEAQAIQAQQSKTVSDLQIANNVFDQSLKDYQSNISGMNNLYQGIGKLAGGYFGSKAGK